MKLPMMLILIVGFLFVETLERLTLAPALRTGILTGFIGGYTTFSTLRWKTRDWPRAASSLKAEIFVVSQWVSVSWATISLVYIARNL